MFDPIRKYATFRGRARRKEYWSFQLAVALLFTAVLIWLDTALGPDVDLADQEAVQAAMTSSPGATLPALLFFGLALFLVLPQLALSVRRLHDSDRTGWWVLLNLIPLGSLVLLVFYLLDGTRGPNRHGSDPKGRSL
jgi:uncharacterized membrane protein YhaH (DUF805 family)